MAKLERVSPSSNNYMRGGARVFVRRSTETSAAGWVHFGNIVNVSTAPDVNSSEHVTGIDGRREVDRRFSDIRSITYTIQVDENTMDNVRLWLAGGAAAMSTQTALDKSSGVKLSVALIGVTAYTDIVVGRWYDISDATGSKVKVFNLDKTYAKDPTNYPTEHVAIGPLHGWAEGTDFLVDYYGAKIMFYTVPLSDYLMYYKATALAQVLTFSPLATAEQNVVAEGWMVMEDGKVVDKWTVPSGRLEPSGNAQVSVENPRQLEYKLIQLKHATDGWGTFTRFYPDYNS